jgi:hypothetical protein
MKIKMFLPVVALLSLSLPAMTEASSFQSIGKTGMGGAGVAVTTDSFASYWNPAGLAFYDKTFNAKFNGGVGYNINSALAENADKLGKLDFKNPGDLNVSSASGTVAALKAAGEAVQFIGILKDIDNRGGAIVITPGGAFSLQYNNYGLGLFVTSEMDVYVNNVDNINIMPADSCTGLATFASSIGAGAYTSRPTNKIFSDAQYGSILLAFSGNATVVNALESQLAASNKAGLPTDQLAQALIDLGKSLGGVNTSIDNNNTSLAVKGLLLSEVPFAYGYKFDLKNFGQLGVGGAFKVIMGTVYGSILSIQESKGSDNIVKKMNDTKSNSTSVGLDLGVAWRKELPAVGQFNAGFVAKNLNSPEFDNPTGFTGKTKVEPQVRMGVAIVPFSWLTIAADLDVTKNKTLAKDNEIQNLAAGIELKPLSFFAFRTGMYSNIAESSSGAVGTFGLSLGPKWLRLDVDGAVATKSAKYKDKSIPREASVEFGLSSMF